MFPNVKNKEEPIKQKVKERDWDDRMTNKPKIPEYSPIKDKHTGSYRKLLMNNSTVDTKSTENQLLAAKKAKRKTFFQKKLDVMTKFRQKHPDLGEELKSYEEAMNKSGAPNFYSYFSLLALLNKEDPKGYIHEQMVPIREHSSPYNRISTAIRARDECLQRLHKTLLKLKQSQILKTKGQLKQEISHLRMLTANVIDQIKTWRTNLGNLDDKPIYYSDEQKNYLLEILNDNKFIFNSQLSGAVNFAQKNDPFIIVPLKKSEGKEKSEYNQIFEIEKDVVYYKKYMEYLASQKAYQLNVAMQQSPQKSSKPKKSSSVQKIYGHNHNKTKIQLGSVEEKLNEDQDVAMMQKQKLREERLKKNQQRINSIKGIYENYASRKKGNLTQRKAPETDVDQKRETFRIKNKTKHTKEDSEFDGLVKLKMDTEKVRQPKQKKIKQSKSMTKIAKLEKNQEKMLDNLKQMQNSLKNKLQLVQKQNKDESSMQPSLSTSRFPKMNQEELIRELKSQIVSKIERQNEQKQKIRKKKKQQQEKAFEEIKLKMKKEMQEKLQQKKRQKMLQKEELQKRLKQQEQRLNNQRQFQIQLQIKLNKQKQMRQLEKIRRQALEKEKKFKQELERQQKLRKERQQAIERQKKEKERLLQELKKKELKEQIQADLKKQIQEKKKIQDEQLMRKEMIALKNRKTDELSRQIELLKLKEKEELNILQKQSQLRQKMLKLKQDQEQLKRKEVQQMMKNMIQKDKQEIDRQALQKRIQIEQEMRTNIKQKMLEEYKFQKQSQIEQNRAKREKQLEEEVYRDKIREKIEKQMRIEAINRTKEDLEEREMKKYEMKTRLDNVKTNLQNNNKLDKNKLEEQVKREVIEKVIFDKNAQRQNAKTQLRAQFEKQLLSSAIPQIYQTKESFMVKNTGHYLNDDHLNRKMESSRLDIPTNQRPNQDQSALKPTKTQIKDVRSIITNQQLQIYSKQKSKVSGLRDQAVDKPPTRLPEQQEGFQLVGPHKRGEGSQDEYDVKIVRKQKAKKSEQVYEKKNKKKKRDDDSDEEEIKDKKVSKKKKKKKKRKQQSESEEETPDSQQIEKRKKKKKVKESKPKTKKKVQKQYSNEQNDDSEYQKKKPIAKKLDFVSDEEQNDRKKQKKSKISKKKKQQSEQSSEEEVQKDVKVHFDADKNKKQPNLTQIQPITIKKTNMKQTQVASKFQISLDAIPEAELDQYLEGHFSRLPEEQVDAQMYEREELFRKLIGQLTFCLLLGHFDNKLTGMAYAYHDRNRSDIRKFVIVHIGTYKNEDLKEFILSISNYIFKKDPTDEIEFHFKYDEDNEAQLARSTDFNKWFDKYGNVYQKRMQNNTFERKYVLKRQFNQKCDVVLGGVNKNTFRNIFSVYSGVIMSDADMVVFKQDLRDILAPEDEVSYAIMMAELFRTYLTPDEAESLKGKVKQFAKLKELLVLVVMLQKKKVKMDELKLYEYKSLIQLNMRLMSQGKDVVRYIKDSGVELNRVFFCELNYGFNLPFNFQTTSLPVQSKENQIRQVSYFRLSPLPPYKLHIIKSAVYNGELNILPTENSKYKLFIMNATEYMELKDSTKMDLFMYIRLFLKNVKSHNVAAWKYVWMPEMMDKGAWSVRQFRSFLSKDIYAHDSVNISYRQFLPGALIIEPEHRDLVITPPFIVGIMSMTLEQVSEGSPLYARLIDIDALRTLQIEQ